MFGVRAVPDKLRVLGWGRQKPFVCLCLLLKSRATWSLSWLQEVHAGKLVRRAQLAGMRRNASRPAGRGLRAGRTASQDTLDPVFPSVLQPQSIARTGAHGGRCARLKFCSA